mgnify:FL=1
MSGIFGTDILKKAIEWLPTDDTVEGLGSGNIGDR